MCGYEGWGGGGEGGGGGGGEEACVARLSQPKLSTRPRVIFERDREGGGMGARMRFGRWRYLPHRQVRTASQGRGAFNIKHKQRRKSYEYLRTSGNSTYMKNARTDIHSACCSLTNAPKKAVCTIGQKKAKLFVCTPAEVSQAYRQAGGRWERKRERGSGRDGPRERLIAGHHAASNAPIVGAKHKFRNIFRVRETRFNVLMRFHLASVGAPLLFMCVCVVGAAVSGKRPAAVVHARAFRTAYRAVFDPRYLHDAK